MVVLFVVILFSVCGIVCGSGGGSSGSGGGGGGAGQECNWIVFSLFCTLDNGHTNKLVSILSLSSLTGMCWEHEVLVKSSQIG